MVINEFPLRGPEWEASIAKSKFNASDKYPYLGERRWYDFAKFSRRFYLSPGSSWKSIL